MIWEIFSFAKILKLRGSLSGKHALERLGYGWTTPFANAWKEPKGQNILSTVLFTKGWHVTHGPPETSQQKPEIEMELSSKDLGRNLLSNEVNSCDKHRKPTKFLRMLYQQNHYQQQLKRIQKRKIKLTFKVLPEFYRQKTDRYVI